MEMIVLILGIAFLIFGFPYIRFIIKRLQLYVKIKKLCAKKKYKLYKNGLMCFLGLNNAQNCNFYIETKNEVYSVKLFGVLKKFSKALIFTDENVYFIRDFTAIPTLSGGFRLPTNGKIQQMINYNYRYRYRDEWEIKNPVNILLINPVPHEIRRHNKNNSEIILGNGDPVHGAQLYSLSGFLTVLERDRYNLQ